jgi:hypothetical protein
MIKRVIVLSIIVSITILLAYGNVIFENKLFGISMMVPENWISFQNQDVIDNLKIFDINKNDRAKFIRDFNGSVLLLALAKYDPGTHEGLIPGIQVNVMENGTKSFIEFKPAIVKSVGEMKNMLSDFNFTKAPQEIEISGIKSIYFEATFTMKMANGSTLKARTRNYSIPYRNYYFQINFNDGLDGEDNSLLFDKLIKTIKIGK